MLLYVHSGFGSRGYFGFLHEQSWPGWCLRGKTVGSVGMGITIPISRHWQKSSEEAKKEGYF
jgi:hypothetical protein